MSSQSRITNHFHIAAVALVIAATVLVGGASVSSALGGVVRDIGTAGRMLVTFLLTLGFVSAFSRTITAFALREVELRELPFHNDVVVAATVRVVFVSAVVLFTSVSLILLARAETNRVVAAVALSWMLLQLVLIAGRVLQLLAYRLGNYPEDDLIRLVKRHAFDEVEERLSEAQRSLLFETNVDIRAIRTRRMQQVTSYITHYEQKGSDDDIKEVLTDATLASLSRLKAVTKAELEVERVPLEHEREVEGIRTDIQGEKRKQRDFDQPRQERRRQKTPSQRAEQIVHQILAGVRTEAAARSQLQEWAQQQRARVGEDDEQRREIDRLVENAEDALDDHFQSYGEE